MGWYDPQPMTSTGDSLIGVLTILTSAYFGYWEAGLWEVSSDSRIEDTLDS